MRSSRSSCPRWASRSPRARSSSGPRAPGTRSPSDETIVEISTDKVDAEVPSPATGTITEILAEAGDTVTVGQVLARMHGRRPGAPRASVTPDGPRRGPCNRSCRHRQRRARAGRLHHLPRRAPHGVHRGRRPLARRRLRPRRAHHEGRRARGEGQRRRGRRGSRSRSAGHRRRGAAHPRRRRDAREVHGREPVDPDRDLVPHADRHDDGRPPQGAEGGRPARVLHPPHRLRDRPRGDRGDAGDGAPLRRDRRQAAPHRRRRREPRHRRRRREEGRLADPHGPGHPRRGAHDVPRVPRRVRRAHQQGAREQAGRRRSHRRQHLADQPGRHRHHRLRPAAHGRPGHHRGHRLDRLPRRPRRHRGDDRRGEGHDDDLDLRPPHHPGRGVGSVPRARRGAPAGRARLLRPALRGAGRRRSARRPPLRRRPPPRRPRAR